MSVDPLSIIPRKPRVLVSACLVGNKVRYDGGDKLQPLFQECFEPWLQLEIHCPEMAAGLGVPRPPIHWVEDTDLRLREVANPDHDVTDQLLDSTRLFLRDAEPWTAAILKARSPSCGSGTTPVHGADGNQRRVGDGVFVQQLKQRFPGICITDELLLNSTEACKRFVYYCYFKLSEFENHSVAPAIQRQLGWREGMTLSQYLAAV